MLVSVGTAEILGMLVQQCATQVLGLLITQIGSVLLGRAYTHQSKHRASRVIYTVNFPRLFSADYHKTTPALTGI